MIERYVQKIILNFILNTIYHSLKSLFNLIFIYYSNYS